MSDSENGGSKGQDSGGGRSRRRRRSRGRRPADSSQGGGGGGSQRSQRSRRSSSGGASSSGSRYASRTPKEKFGGREPRGEHEPAFDGVAELTPFELFCAYHLGITDDNGYRKPRAPDVARRFDISVNEMNQALSDFGIDREALERCDFDVSLAQLDIKVVPPGVDRRELAKVHFEELVELSPEVARACAEVEATV